MTTQVYIGAFLFLTVCLPLVSSSFSGAPTVCGLPADPGNCLGFFPRWYYNSTNNACQKFVYGGCGGNANNFPDFFSCFLNCGGIIRCWLPQDTGPCLANFPRYFYNVGSETCEDFIYGGCLGNANRFDNIDECEFQCADGPFASRNRNQIANRRRGIGYNQGGH